MEATMKSASSKEKLKMPSITGLMGDTPNLEKYIIANILTKCGRPENYDGKYKFIIYKDWVTNKRQNCRINFYHKKLCKRKEMLVTQITSYFIKVGIKDISISYPDKSTQDLFIVFPTEG
tara:strand:+ start:72 stop:431 length:360 start_codon:yes stop_codon:yes gene_type:complete